MGRVCDECGVSMVERHATPEVPYRYTLSGMNNVFLVGIVVRECPQCGGQSPVIPRIGELHRVIANCLIEKPGQLVGQEIRFLRKYAGLPAWKFAIVIGETASHVSRVETENKTLGKPADRLVRALAMDRKEGQALVDALLEIIEHPAIEQHSTSFRLERRGWKACAASRASRMRSQRRSRITPT